MSDDKRSLRVAAVQFESKPADKDANFKKIEPFVQLASAQGVRLIVFPECCITGYWFIRNLSVAELAALSEPIPDGQSTQRLIALARPTTTKCWRSFLIEQRLHNHLASREATRVELRSDRVVGVAIKHHRGHYPAHLR